MNNTLEVLHLSRGSEIEHSHEAKYIWRVETVEKTRDSFVDQLKGLACFLVVFGHVIMGIRKAGIPTLKSMVFVEEYIWTFHVPLFMFLSGYVYRLTGGWEAKGTRKKFLLHKLFNLGIPYFVFSSIYILINSVTSGVNNSSSISDILMLWRTPVAQYWFLYALFILFVIWSIIPGEGTTPNLILTTICTFVSIMPINLGVFASSMRMSLFFGLGTVVNIKRIREWPLKIKNLVIITQVLGAILFLNIINENAITSRFFSVLGIVTSIVAVSLLDKCDCVEKCMLVLNRYSFPIYLLHTIFTAGFRIVFLKVGVNNYLLHVLLGIIVGIGIPIIGMNIIKNCKILLFLFYPSSTVMYIREKSWKQCVNLYCKQKNP